MSIVRSVALCCLALFVGCQRADVTESPFALVDGYLAFLTPAEKDLWCRDVESKGICETMRILPDPPAAPTGADKIATPKGMLGRDEYARYSQDRLAVTRQLRTLVNSLTAPQVDTPDSPYRLVDRYLDLLWPVEKEAWFDHVKSQGLVKTLRFLPYPPSPWTGPCDVYGVRTPNGGKLDYEGCEQVFREGETVTLKLRNLAGSHGTESGSGSACTQDSGT